MMIKKLGGKKNSHFNLFDPFLKFIIQIITKLSDFQKVVTSYYILED